MPSVRLCRTSSGRIALAFCNRANEVARRILYVRVEKSQWDAKRQKIINHPCGKSLNIDINNALNTAQAALLRFTNTNPSRHLTSAQLRDKVCALAFADANSGQLFVNEWKKFAAEKKGRTRELYDLTLSQMLSFDSGLHSREIEEIDAKWIGRFVEYCRETKATNTINIRLRCIRAFFNWSIDNELTTEYPFRKIKIKNEDIIRHDLPACDLIRLLTSKVPDGLSEGIAAARFMFYLIGINAKDLHALTPESVSCGRVVYMRAKTHKAYSIKLQHESEQIISEYGGRTKLLKICERYASHTDLVKRINRDLRAFCSLLDISPITTNWLRHGWATFALNECGVSMDTISIALGHSFGNRVTRIYPKIDLAPADTANRLVLDTIKARC